VLLETLKLLHVAGPLPSNRIASLSCSGGEASLMADLALGTRLTFPPLTAAQKTGLRAALGPKVALANPLDYHTYIWGDEAAITRTFTAAADPGLDMLCVVLDFPRADRCTSPEWQHVVNGLRAAGDATGVKVALIGSLPENMPEDQARRALDLGIVPFCGMDEALAAMSAAVMPETPAHPAPLVATAPADPRLLTEAEAKGALASFGVPVPQSQRATGAAEVGGLAEAIGFPVVLKGEGFAHKTEVGAVALGLTDRAAAEAAARAMPATTFLVEEQVTGAVAELLVGVVSDPASGYVLTLGAGGTLTELHPHRTAGSTCSRSRSTAPRPTPSTSPPAGSWARSSPSFRDDPELRVALLTAAGEKFFCPGWDLKAAAEGDAVDGDYGVGGFGGPAGAARAEQAGDHAAVNGICCGGGLELALSATSSSLPSTPPSPCPRSARAPWPMPPRSSCPSASPTTSRWRCC
jgi:hypothetical protein